MTPEVRERIEQIRYGNVPDGYRKTKAGILPDDWTVCTIGECLERIERPVDVQADELYTQIGIRSHGKGLFHKEPVTGESLGNKAVYWIEPDCFVLNIVFAWEQAIGKTTQAEAGMIGSHRFPMYRPIDGEVDIDYLISYLLTKRGKDILEAASPGGAGRNRTLGQDRFMKSKIVLPSPDEQKKIAKILTTQDKVIELKEKRLAAKHRQKKYLMQQLLTGKKRLPGFDGEWSSIKIGDVCTINARNESIADQVVTFLGMSDVSEDGKILNHKLIPYDDIGGGFTPFKKGDVLVAKITPCFENGKGACTDDMQTEHGFGSTEFHVLRGKGMINSKYLFYHTQAELFRRKLEKEMIGSAGQKRVQADSILRYEFKLPALTEQNAIVNVLSTGDKGIELLQEDIEQEKQKKKALMQLLLTGIVRV